MITVEHVFTEPAEVKFDSEFFKQLNASTGFLTEEKSHIMRHALGLERRSIPYRNHYSVHNLSATHQIILEMVQEGYMRETQRTGEYVYYEVTGKGKEYIGARSDLDEYTDAEIRNEYENRRLYRYEQA